MITIYERNQSYRVVLGTSKYLNSLHKFVNMFTQIDFEYDYKSKRTVKVIKKKFTGGNQINNEFIINRNSIKTLISILKYDGCSMDEIKIISRTKSTYKKIELEVLSILKPRDYQIKYEEAIIKNDNIHAKLIDLVMGGGKTYITSNVITKVSHRTMFLLLPMYINKWIADLTKHFKINGGDILIVKGRTALMDFLSLDKNEIKFKFVLVSLTTITSYFKEYEETPLIDMFETPIQPYDITREFDIGMVVVDEVHRELHNVFKCMLYLDPKLLLGLSATFMARDKVIQYAQETLFEEDSRLSLLVSDPYINVTAIGYTLVEMHTIVRKARTHKGYNHNNFETFFLKRKTILKNYRRMIKHYVDKEYIAKRDNGDKCIIFCSTKAMCGYLADFLQSCYPHLSVKRYVGEDDESDLYDSDIRVTTIGSGGEAVDIPRLIYGLLTVSIDAEIANIQAMGRLRELNDKEVNYNYLYSVNIPSHIRYHKNKLELFHGRVKTHRNVMYHQQV